MYTEEKVIFKNSQNLNLAGILTLPDTKTDKIIVLAHGISSEKDEEGTFKDLAHTLAEEGFHVFRFDFQGHGESEGDSVNLTISGEIDDLRSALTFLQDKGYSRFGIVGASFGGSITCLLFSDHLSVQNIQSICLWNPTFDYDSTLLNPVTEWGQANFGPEAMRQLAAKGYFIINPELHGGFRLGQSLMDELRQFRPYYYLANIHVPLLVIHGSEDSYVPCSDSEKYYSLAPDSELLVIKGAEHGFFEDEQHAQQALKATLDFFKKTLI